MTTTAPPEPAVELHYSSHSSLTHHRRCPQLWFYIHVKRYEVRLEEGGDAAVERDFGSWWHALRAADSIARGRELGSLQWVPLELRTVNDGPRIPTNNVGVVDVLLRAKSWYDSLPPSTRDEWVLRIGEPL